MSHQGNQSKAELDFEIWLDEQGFCTASGEYYICPGDHVWHEDDVTKLYDEAVKNGWKNDD
jgi:hypothetical protein